MANQISNDMSVGTTEAPSLNDVTLAPSIGENNEVPSTEPKRYTYQQEEDYINKKEAAKQLKQGQEAQSLLNAATPTPTGAPVRPPIAEALSNLGKIEPAQVGAASLALGGLNPDGTPKVSGAPAAGTTSILNQIPQTQVPQVSSGGPGAVASDAVTDAYNRQIQAANTIADATKAKADADQKQFALAEKAYADAEIKRAATKAQFDTDYTEKMNSYQQSIADYKQAAGEKVVPGQSMANMDTSQKIQAGIFMALSSYGSAISGQENQALKVINNAINLDIDAQKFNIENKLKGAHMGVEGSQYMLSQMRLKFGDDTSAELATRAALLDATQQQLNINASKLDGDTAGPKAKAANAQIEIQKQQYLQQLKQAQAQAFTLQQLQGADMKNLTWQQINTMNNTVDKEFGQKYVPGFGVAKDAEQSKKFIEYNAEIGPAIASLDRIKQIAKGFNKLSLTQQGILKTELASLVGSLRIPITGPGILTESERKMLENDVIGNPGKLVSLPSIQKAKLDTIYAKLTGDLERRGAMAGLPASSFKQASKKSTFKD